MTSTLSRMRQIEERQVEHEVKLLEWSPKMDILAVGLFNGDVSLHRLNWQKNMDCILPRRMHMRSFILETRWKSFSCGIQ